MIYDELINLFGNLLSELLNKPPVACKGLFRFAIKDYEKSNDLETGEFLKFKDFEKIIGENIKSRLEAINFENIDKIISTLSEELIKFQSIFTFLA
jgi:hypothetical protein